MIILLSPAKTLDLSEYEALVRCTKPLLMGECKKAHIALKQLSKLKLEKLLGVSPKLAKLNHERMQNFKTPFTKKNAKPALLAYKGDVYRAMNIEKFGKKEFEFAQKYLRIISAFYGILKPFDLIQAYRLEMNANTKSFLGSNLYDFWAEAITKQVKKDLGADKTIINLASNQYFKAISYKRLDAQIITPIFKEKKGSEYKTVAIFAKKARGMMTNFIISNKIQSPNKLTSFNIDGYKFNKKMSSDSDFIFTRNK